MSSHRCSRRRHRHRHPSPPSTPPLYLPLLRFWIYFFHNHTCQKETENNAALFHPSCVSFHAAHVPCVLLTHGLSRCFFVILSGSVASFISCSRSRRGRLPAFAAEGGRQLENRARAGRFTRGPWPPPLFGRAARSLGMLSTKTKFNKIQQNSIESPSRGFAVAPCRRPRPDLRRLLLLLLPPPPPLPPPPLLLLLLLWRRAEREGGREGERRPSGRSRLFRQYTQYSTL